MKKKSWINLIILWKNSWYLPISFDFYSNLPRWRICSWSRITRVVLEVPNLTYRWRLSLEKKYYGWKCQPYKAWVRSLQTLRCLVFVWQLSMLDALSEFVNMEKTGHRYVIQYFHSKGLSPTNIRAELDSTLGEPAPSFTRIKYWMAEFERGRTSCQYEHSSGQPNEVTTSEMVKKIHKMVLNDRRLRVLELADMVRREKIHAFSVWYWPLLLNLAQSRTSDAWKWCSLSKVNNHITLVWICTHSVLLTHVLHDLIVKTTRNRSTALFVVQTLERPYHFGMEDRAFSHLGHAHLVVTWKKLGSPIPERYGRSSVMSMKRIMRLM